VARWGQVRAYDIEIKLMVATLSQLSESLGPKINHRLEAQSRGSNASAIKAIRSWRPWQRRCQPSQERKFFGYFFSKM
jgi:hypothetical protein